ncbi:MAG: ribosome biogenesis protein [Candidatus Heimdallarchaeota archaeon]|nr:ribosome biogenesis protein [Candidatus Heimdallarchaeota archaeon]
MTKSIYRCIECKEYTLNEQTCPHCGKKTVSPQPARFSLEKEKKYSKYRRRLFKDQLQSQ